MSAMYSVLLNLKPPEALVISPTQGHHAYALFLNLMHQANPKLAENMHKDTANKPFTISPLQGKFLRSGKELKLIPGSIYSIRLTFLTEEVFCYFMDAVLKNANKPLRLESAVFNIDRLLLNKNDSPLCDFRQYEELLSGALPEKKITLHFSSPVAFRSGGKRNVIFPDPRLIFGSYYNKWQDFSPLKLDDSLTGIWERIIVSQYRLNTHILHFTSYQEIGFEGHCTFELPEDLNGETSKVLNTLADFAFYCGTGAKTTMGMGQTRRTE